MPKKRKISFWICFASILAAFGAFFLVSYFAVPYLTQTQEDRFSLLSEAVGDKSLNSGWEKDGASFAPMGELEISPGQKLAYQSQRVPEATKYVHFTLKEEAEASNFSLKAYSGPELVLSESKTPVAISDEDGYSFECLFSYEFKSISSVSLEYKEYNGGVASTKVLLLKQFSFYYLA